MTDVRRYAADLRVELLASSQLDACDTLTEITERLFGEEHVVTIVVPDSASIHPVKESS